jgi:peptide/nickel transport system permease protein
MARFVITRLLSSIALFFAITLFVFVAFFVLPASTGAARRPGHIAGNVIVRDTYWAHGSFPHQYSHYVWNFVRHGDLGRSYVNREAVTERLRRAVPVTLSLVLGGVLVWLLISIPLGILSALRPRSLLDRSSTVFVTIGLSAHPVWLGLVLGYLLGYKWHVVPVASYCEMVSPKTPCGGPVQWAWHLLLPWLIFGLVNAALFTSMVRASVLEVLSEDYVRTARAKGAGEGRVLRVHVLRNVLLPLVTMIGMNFAVALGGVIFIESVFNLPGLGQMFRSSLLQRDLPVTAGIVIFMTLAIMVTNLVVDLLYTALDPRVRVHSSLRPEISGAAVPEAAPARPLELPA